MQFHDSWFFIGVFVFIFLIWVATGGPTHPISFAGPSLAQPAELGGGTYLSLPRAGFGFGSAGTVSLPGSSNGETVPGVGTQASAPLFVGGTAYGPVSPYHGIVSMNHYVSGAGSSDPNNEYLELYLPSSASVPVDLSGWRLVSGASSASVTIPKGTEVPTSGTINDSQAIVLNPGDHAIFISGRSPIGASFKENKCIGYFGTFQTFSPQLPQNCPSPQSELAAFYPGDSIRDSSCVDYVKNIQRCQILLSPPVSLSSTCQSFLIKYLNYNGCMNAHRNDADFDGKTWRIYLGRTSALWRTRNEVVKLIDMNGKTVDAFSY